MKKVLVTGGAGYIGSHAVKSLLEKKYSVVIVDDLSTGYEVGLNTACQFYKSDITKVEQIESIFAEHEFDLVMHFAAKLDVAESNIHPAKYYDCNVVGTKNILDMMVKYKVKDIIFSSTAAVYGLLDTPELIDEEDITIPINSYGETKLSAENMIKWYSMSYGINYMNFRYFNVVGSCKPGADLTEMTTVLPKIIRSIRDNTTFNIFGGDYDTSDGTCIRDYIHVNDIVSAHVLGAGIINSENSGVYNLSIGEGTTVLELISACEDALDKKITYEIVAPRVGDPVKSAATNTKISSIIDWNIEYNNIKDMIVDTFNSWV